MSTILSEAQKNVEQAQAQLRHVKITEARRAVDGAVKKGVSNEELAPLLIKLYALAKPPSSHPRKNKATAPISQ